MKKSLDELIKVGFLPKPFSDAKEINKYYNDNKAIIDDFLDELNKEYKIIEKEVGGFDPIKLADSLNIEFSKYIGHLGMRKLAELQTIYNYLVDNNYGERASSLYQVYEAINTANRFKETISEYTTLATEELKQKKEDVQHDIIKVINILETHPNESLSKNIFTISKKLDIDLPQLKSEVQLANTLKPIINDYKIYLQNKAKKFQIIPTIKHDNLMKRIEAITNLSEKIETGAVSLDEVKECMQTCLKNNYNLASEKTFFHTIVNLVPVLFKAFYTIIKPSNEKSFQAALKQTLGEIKKDSDVSPPEPDENPTLKI